MAAYTRKVTVVWSVYFVLMAALSIGAVPALAPFAAWAMFANLLTPLAMALLFVGEFLLRYRLHPGVRAGVARRRDARLLAAPRAAPADRTP